MKLLSLVSLCVVALAVHPLDHAKIPKNATAGELHRQLAEISSMATMKGPWTGKLIEVLQRMKDQFAELQTADDLASKASQDRIDAAKKIIETDTVAKALTDREAISHGEALKTIDALITSIRGNVAFQGLDEGVYTNEQMTSFIAFLKTNGVILDPMAAPCYSTLDDTTANVILFHRGCDEAGPTVTVIRGGNGRIGGGFNGLNWKGNPGFTTDAEAFLFSLGTKWLKFPAQSSGSEAYCIRPTYGPTFGAGFNLHLSNGLGASYSGRNTAYIYTEAEDKVANGEILGGYSAWRVNADYSVFPVTLVPSR